MSKWHNYTNEQKQNHLMKERARRAERKLNLTDEQRAKLSEQRKASRARRKARDLEHHKLIAREYKRNGRGWFSSWASQIKARAELKGVACNIDADYLISIMPDVCPVFNVPLIRRNTRTDNSPWAPTVDRLVPELGYIRGNIRIISRRANNIKSDASVDEIRAVANWLESQLG